MVLPHEEDGDGNEDFEAAFNRTYRSEFGFMLDTKNIIIDDIKVSPTANQLSTYADIHYMSHRFVVLGKHLTVSMRQSTLN